MIMSEKIGAPTGLTATAISPSRIDLAWDIDPAIVVTGHKIYRSTREVFSCNQASFIEKVTANAFLDTKLKASKTYYYRVTVVNESGQESTPSSPVKATTHVQRRIQIKDDDIDKLVTDLAIKVEDEKTYKTYDIIQARADREDILLNNRTSSFLTANAIFLAVTQIQNVTTSFFRLGLVIVGIIVTIFWLLISNRTATFIHFFHDLLAKIRPEYLNFIHSYRRPKFTPTNIMAYVFPVTILIGWSVYFVFLLFTL